MYFIGIDVSKYKHDCFIVSDTGEVIFDVFTFQNTNQGFSEFLQRLNILDSSQEKRIGFESTSHLHSKILGFFLINGSDFHIFVNNT